MTTTNILIVEDESIIALDIKRSLMSLGYHVVAIADTGEAALDLAAQTHPDLVLMDIRLRGEMDGITAAHYLREHLNLPVVFLTAHADEATLNQAKLTQPFGYVVKPFEAHDLSTAVEIALSRHQAECSIQLALQKERELHNLKTQFVSIVSHEFRNPLSSIQFCLDLLNRQEHHFTAEKKQVYIERAQGAVERMKQLLEDVLVVGEAESGDLQFNPMPIDLFWFCREILEDLQQTTTTGHTLTLSTNQAHASEYPFYSFDTKLLRHILSNLLSNAIKYSPQGSEVSLEVICQPGQVVFCIKDSGIGIPEADQEKLFTPFFRAGNVNAIPGTGLGLCIVKKCVDAHGGAIAVESQVGVGTTFTITLPAHTPPSQELR